MKRIRLSLAAFTILSGILLAWIPDRRIRHKGQLYFTAWFTYIGSNQNARSFNKTSNYTFYGTNAPTCTGSTALCAIQVTATYYGGILSSGGTFGSPLGTNVAATLTYRNIHLVWGANGEHVEVNNQN